MVLLSTLNIWATGKDCLLEPKHRKFTGCDVDGDCGAKIMPSLLLIFTEQVLNTDLDTTRSGDVQNAGKFYLAERTAGFVGLRKTVWKAPRRLCFVQVFPKTFAILLRQ